MGSIFTGLHEVNRVVRIGREEYKLDFDHLMIGHAEQVYAVQFNRQVNGGIIIAELLAGTMSALMAVVYGAIRSGGRTMPWEKFSKEIWGTDKYDAIFEVASDAAVEMFGGLSDGASEDGGSE